MPTLETDLSTTRQWLDLSLAQRAVSAEAYSLLRSARLRGEVDASRHDGIRLLELRDMARPVPGAARPDYGCTRIRSSKNRAADMAAHKIRFDCGWCRLAGNYARA